MTFETPVVLNDTSCSISMISTVEDSEGTRIIQGQVVFTLSDFDSMTTDEADTAVQSLIDLIDSSSDWEVTAGGKRWTTYQEATPTV